MNKKKLPKAIMRAADDMRETTPALGALEPQGSSARSTASSDPAAGAAAAQGAGHEGDVIEVASAMQLSSPPAARALANAAPADAELNATRRRTLARAIVERHTAYSAVGGLIPVPIANVAGITAVIVRMVKVLSGLYGVPFERDRARAIVIGLMGGTMPTGLAAVTTSTLVNFIPGTNLIGLAVSSLAGAACTRGIGRIFIEHFESGATLTDFPASESR